MSDYPSIPKIIHYCWFGEKEIPKLGKRCIESWHKYLPEYEIMVWNEYSFDVDSVPFTREAYKRGEYAFVSDYVRFWALYTYGGLYFDTDVEIIKPLTDIISNGPFMGTEHTNPTNGVSTGLGMGCYSGMPLFAEIIETYKKMPTMFSKKTKSEYTVVKITTAILLKYGLRAENEIQNVAGVNIYPQEYFCPNYYGSKITENTVSIHYFAGSWLSLWGKFKKLLRTIMPSFISSVVYKFKYKN